jgi:hypothetical protein
VARRLAQRSVVPVTWPVGTRLNAVSSTGRERPIYALITAEHAEWAGAIVVEHRYIWEIVRGALDDGLAVR